MVLTLAAVGTEVVGVIRFVAPIGITFSSDQENGAYLGLGVEGGLLQRIRNHVVDRKLRGSVIQKVIDHDAFGQKVVCP